MTVTGSCDQTVAAEQIKFYTMSAGKGAVCPVSIWLIVALFKMFINIVPIDWEQIQSFIGSLIEPGEVVDTQNIDHDIPAVDILDSGDFFADSLQYLLGAEYLMTAAKCLDLREGMVQNLYAQGHWVGVVDDPCLRAVLLDRISNVYEHWECTQRTDDSTRTCGVANGLIDA